MNDKHGDERPCFQHRPRLPTASGAAPLTYQWQRNLAPIPGANAASYTLFSPTLADNGAQFRCVVTNTVGQAVSASAVLTVNDSSAPSLTSQNPAPSATGVALNTPVVIVFAADIDSASLNSTTFRLAPQGSATPLAALVTYNSSSRTASLVPLANLLPATTYTVRLVGGASGVRSSTGTQLPADITWSFTTLDNRAFAVSSFNPADGTRQVAVDSVMRVTFNKSVDPSTVNATTLTVTRKTTTTPVPATVSYDAATRTATITPTSPLLINWTYTIAALGGAGGVRDLGGNPLAATTTALFYTTDTLPPRIYNVSVSNITATTATIVWDTDEIGDTQVLYGKTTTFDSATTLDPALRLHHVVNLTGLSPNTTYHYQVRSKDSFNNQGGTTTDFTFTTAP